MSEERVVDEIVTKFLLNTCRLRPGTTLHSIHAAVFCASLRHDPKDDLKVALIPLTTGSVAEFYIEPMLPYVGDIDIMAYDNSLLAIPEGHPPPTVLPSEFYDNVMVFEIIDTNLSGYVHLNGRYLLTKYTDCGRYSAVEKRGGYLTMYSPDVLNVEHHGPAFRSLTDRAGYLSIDRVACVRCLSWPPQAAAWPTRHRNYDWPDSATVDRVVSNGCDMVQVAHRQCREDELAGKLQWRLSFSRAEIILLNSWMPAQQIVYHMLRFFMRTEHLTESTTPSNYQIKTLMLWACELKQRSRWTVDLSLVRICVELLQIFAVWLSESRCKSYFINCNLVDTSSSLKVIAGRLLSIDRHWLSLWFVNNYIQQSAHVCPQFISQLFDDVSTNTKLENAVSALVDWRLKKTAFDMLRAFSEGQWVIANAASKFANAPSFVYDQMIELANADGRLCVYAAGVALLNIACKLARTESIDNLMKALTVASNEFVHSSKYDNDRAFSLVKKVVTLARDYQRINSTNCNPLELAEMFQQTAVELLTIFRELEAQYFGWVATIVTTDFEALYAYKCGNYQRCFELSTENVRTLLYVTNVPDISTFPEFLQLLDDDIVSLTALLLIINPECRGNINCAYISQLTLSLYLMTQCQLKLRHSLTSLVQTRDYIRIAHARRARPNKYTLDQLILKLAGKKVATYITA